MGMEDANMGVEDIEFEGVDPISKLPKYLPPRQGKVKVPKDLDERKISLHTLLLWDRITFEGPRLVRVTHLKLKDWDLADT